MTLAAVAAAFLYGLVGSLHCAAMCGPLCCAFLAARDAGTGAPSATSSAARRDALRSVLAYTATRVLAYAALGGIAGAIGQGAARVAGILSSRTALFVFAAFLLAVALPWRGTWSRLATRIGLPSTLRASAGLVGRIADVLLGLPRSARGAFLGLATPALPCGFLYGALAGSIAAGSLAGGLVTMLAFGIGTAPILVALVVGAGSFAGRISTRGARRLQQGIAIFAALGLLYMAVRMPEVSHGKGESAPPSCPHCASDTVP